MITYLCISLLVILLGAMTAFDITADTPAWKRAWICKRRLEVEASDFERKTKRCFLRKQKKVEDEFKRAMTAERQRIQQVAEEAIELRNRAQFLEDQASAESLEVSNRQEILRQIRHDSIKSGYYSSGDDNDVEDG